MPRDDIAGDAGADRILAGPVEPAARRRLAPDTGEALIGPNAVLQLLPVLDAALGVRRRTALMARAGVAVPAADRMIPETDAACLHRRLRAELGPRAAGLAAQAGRRTADYILAHRIPGPAQALLRALPPRPAARLLSRAIAQHAWTFVGSGRLELASATRLILHDNPVIAGERARTPLCHWHAAVFETLYRRLVHPAATCRETACAATGAPACVFDVTF